MTTYTLRHKATKRAAQALSTSLGIACKDYSDFWLADKQRFAKTQREQVDFLLTMVNNGLAQNEEALLTATYSYNEKIFSAQ